MGMIFIKIKNIINMLNNIKISKNYIFNKV